jgi:hypothetical protein
MPRSSIRVGGRSRPVRLATSGGGRSLITAIDFTYLGAYVVDSSVGGGGLTFAGGLTHRYVGGELRFLTMGYGGAIGADPVCEFKLNPSGYGSTISSTQQTNSWSEIFSPALSGPNIGGGDHFGLYWDEGKSGLWASQATDYPTDGTPGSNTGDYTTSCVTFRTLGSGTIANFKGPYGFSGIGQRAIYGGVRAVPLSLRSMSGGYPYSYGFGGYSSRLAQGYTPSLGLMVVAGPDVTGYTSPTAAIATTDFKVVADHTSGASASSDWYGSGVPTSFDRGARTATVTNYYDNGDPRSNPTTPPSVAPAPGAGWLSPSPDGSGRWVWGDTYSSGSVAWIDGASKYGFVAVASLATGKAFYMTSTLNYDAREVELHVYDPARFGEVAAGTRAGWAVQPATTRAITATAVPGGYSTAGTGFTDLVRGATFDQTTNILWLWMPGVDTSSPYNCRLAAYSVNC